MLSIHWKDWCWNSNTLATWYEELTHWKRPRCWERLRAGEEGDDRRRDGWLASLTQWIWVWAGSRRWWRTGKPGMLQFMGSQRVRHDWVTKLNWTLQLGKLGLNPLLSVAGGVAWTRSFISLSFRSPKCETGLTMGLSTQVCCEKWWDNVCRPLIHGYYSDDDYNCCWFMITSLHSAHGFSSIYDPTAHG